MDQKLLQALNNVGFALESLTEAIQSNQDAKSSTAEAIKSGNFGKQLESITVELKSIKSDTQQILKNQETIISLSKEKEKEKEKEKTKPFADSGSKEQQSAIKKGVGTILLIAGAVLAIGLALKLVGPVDVISAIGLGIAMVAIGHAFAKVAEATKDYSVKEIAMVSLSMVFMATAITASSWIMSLMRPISLTQGLTAIFISAVFVAISINLEGLSSEVAKSYKILGMKAFFVMPLILVAISTAITVSSWIMSMISPISLTQGLTAIFISAVFVTLAINLERLSIGVAIAYKILGMKAILAMPIVLTAIAAAITASSWIMSMISPISFSQSITAILIGVTFAIMSYVLPQLALGVVMVDKILGKGKVWIIPVVLTAIAAAITASSWIMSMISPLSFSKAITAILIGATFAIMSYVLPQLAQGVAIVDKILGEGKVWIIPVVLGAIALAITASSWILGLTQPIGIWQFLTALGIVVLFAIMSYVLPEMATGVAIVAKVLGTGKVWIIPVILVAISTAIMLSSHILSYTADISFMLLLKVLALGVVMAALTTILIPAFVILGKMGVGSLLKGGLAILIVATAVMVSSHILALGDYDVYPGIGWIAGVALSLTAFGVAAFALGALVFGPQALIFLAGLGAVLGLAGTIVGVSKILSAGQYDNPGMLEWAKATSLLYATFTPILLILGTAALASAVVSIFGPDPWKMAQDAILDVANTIVQVSYILQEGNYSEGPTKEWAEGIAIALGAFSPVYGMLMKNAIFSLFGGGGVGPDEFTEAILTVSDGIITAANKFANANAAFNNPPPVEWADGVGKAISAFSPVYKVLAEQDGWFVDGPSVEDMKNAIITISEGIVEAAKYFAENSAPFEEGKYPSAKWGEGVGAALNAFAPVFKALSEDTGWFTSGDDVIGNMGKGIRAITKSLVESAIIFSLFNGAFGVYPDEEWGKGVGASLNAFAPVFKSLSEDTGWFTSGDDVIQDMAKGVRVLSYSLVDAAKAFSSAEGIWGAYPDESWAKGVSLSINSYMDLFAELEERGYTTLSFSVNSKVLETGIASMVSVASMLFNNKDYFTVQLDNNFIANIATNILGFAKLGLELDNMLVSEKTITTENSGFMGIGASKKEETVRVTKDMGIVEKVTANLINVAKMLFFNKEFFTETDNYSKFYTDIVSMSSGIIWRFTKLANRLNANEDLSFWNIRRTASNLVRTAKILHGGQEYFGLEVDPNYMKNVSQNIIDFNNLVKQLVESEGDKGFLEKIGDATDSLLGTDPISQIARRMITLAEGYDALASSLTKLGIAMKTLNITDVRMLGGLTRTLTAPSGDVNVGGNKGKESSFVNKKTTTSVNTSTAGTTFGNKIGGDVSISDKLDEVIKLLSNIDKSTGSVDSLIGQYLGDEDAPSSAPDA